MLDTCAFQNQDVDEERFDTSALMQLTSGQLELLVVLTSIERVSSEFSVAFCVDLFSFQIFLNTPLSFFLSGADLGVVRKIT